jgi:hypothetical protein
VADLAPPAPLALNAPRGANRADPALT